MRLVIIPSLLLVMTSAAMADQTTQLHHADGTTTTVTTDRLGTQVITPDHGGGNFGSDIRHDDIVHDYTRPGDSIGH